MTSIRRELEIFFAALRFFTRLPVPAWVGHSQQQLNFAARYFPAVGIIVGAIGALVTGLAAFILPASLAVLLGMAATILATGAFHEDGLTDACDGFGGGWDKAQVLDIMKDSRIGSYGAIAIALTLFAKWTALMELDDEVILVAIIAAHAVSRLASTLLIRFLVYVRFDETAKSKPLAEQLTPASMAIALIFGLAPCLGLAWPEVAIALALVALVTWLAARYFVRRIGGYTGDCLGATQQIAELAFYFGLLCSFT